MAGNAGENRQSTESDLADLLDRCEVAAEALDRLADQTRNVRSYDRLSGKAEGVRLAASYIAELQELGTPHA